MTGPRFALTILLSIGVTSLACGDEEKNGSTVGSASSSTSDTPTTSTTGEVDEATTSTSTETGTSEDDAVCELYGAHVAECFPRDVPNADPVEKECKEAIDVAREVGQACPDAMIAYFMCLSIAPCEVFEDSCIEEAYKRIQECGG